MTESKYGIMNVNIVSHFKWTTGRTAGMTLTAFRDEGRFLAFKCPSCNKVIMPAKDICGECFVPLEENPVEVGPGGAVTTFTVVREGHPESPVDAPYVLGAVRLDGADTDLLAIILADTDGVRAGMRVKPVWNEERNGTFRDLKGFAPE